MKFSLLIKSYVLVAFLFLVSESKATNYYVDPSSTSSTQNGAQATPWKTLSQVQSNMSSFQPGDFIYFKKGETFSGTLNITKSGTASAPITFATYGTSSAAPVFTSTSSDLITIDSRQYIVFDGFKITDPTLDPNDRNQQSIIDRAFAIDGSSYITVKNCDISLVGVGINMVGNYCTMDHCTIGNLRMIKNTPGGDDDYGANPVVISGSNNNITNNYFKDCWAYSYDYTYDGGAIEVYGAANSNNKIMYNVAMNCDGFMEIGFSGGGTTNDNLVAYNKIINCGELVYISNSGTYATAVNNLQFYNNDIVHTVNQLTMPTSMIGMSSSSSTPNIINLKNNIFWLTTGIDVARSGKFTGTQLTHEDNIYHLGTGSILNFTTNSSELTTTETIFTSTAGSDPNTWNYTPAAGSPAIDFGQNLGIAKDFAGNAVPAVPNAGILEGGSGSGSNPLSASSTSPSITCNGGTATVTVSATGGTAPYTGTGTHVVSAGTYTYTVTDAAGATATTSITVTQATAITATVSAGTITVYGGTTTVGVSASGGTPSYTYQLNSGSFQSSNSFTAVPAGNHSVTIKDKNGCTILKTITITQPGSPNPLAATSSAGSISCNKGTTTVTVNATGGKSPYTGTGTHTVGAGTYTYTVTDAAGATASTSITITQPTAITVTVAAGTVTGATGTTTATVTASGGTPGYTYSIDGGSYQSSNSFTGVDAGDHSVTVRDGKACTSVKSFTVSVTGTSPLVIHAVAGTIACNGGNTTVTMSATGGVAPYTGIGNFTVTAGTYTYIVTDATGVTGTTTVTVTQPTLITGSLTAGTITTTGGTTTITVAASGGSGSYTYKLNSGSYQSSNSFTGVPVGTHTVTIKDAKGCTITKSITITKTTGTGAFKLTLVSKTNETCKGKKDGKIVVAATGGVGPYTYRLNSVGAYTSSGTFTNLNPGFYFISAKSASGATTSIFVIISGSKVACTTKAKSDSGMDNVAQTGLIDGLKINAYPNPTSSEFSLVIENGSREEAQIVVMNLNGQKVYETKSKVYEKNIFGRNFVSGIYIVKVTQGQDSQTLKLVKAK